MAERFTVEAVFKALDRVTAPVRKMQTSVSRFTRRASVAFEKLNRAVRRLTRGVKTLATRGAAGLLVFGAAIRKVVTTGADFGRQIGIAAATFPVQIKRGTEAFRELERAARDVGAATEFTATAVAGGLGFLAKAGFKPEQAIASLSDIVNFATATQLDFAEAADIASDTLGSFGLDSDDTATKLANLNRVMDVMSFTAQSTNTSVAEMFEAVRQGGPALKAVGGDIEDFATIAGTLAQAGIKGSAAGTAIKNIALAQAGVGNNAADAFRELQIPLADSTGKLRDQLEVLEDLRGVLDTLTQQEQVGVTAAIFGKIPFAAVQVLLGQVGDKTRKFREELDKLAPGSTKRTADAIRDDVKGSLDALGSAIEGVQISIFALNEGALKQAIDRMTEWVRVNEKAIATGIGEFLLDLINNFQEIGEKVLLFTKIGASIIILNTIVQTLVGTFTLLNIIVAANPIVLAISAIVIVVTTLVTFIEELLELFENLPLPIRRILLPFEAVLGVVKLIKDTVSDTFFPNEPSTGARAAGVQRGARAPLAGGLGAAAFPQVPIFNDGGQAQSQALQAPVSPQERAEQREITRTNNSNAEVTIRTEEGTQAEVTRGNLGAGIQISPTGIF